MTNRSPSLLIVATAQWPMAARLGMCFRDLGASVSWFGPTDHPLDYVHGMVRHFQISTRNPIESLQLALEQSGADWIVPTDDVAVRMLHGLAEARPELTERIGRSLGDEGRFAVIRSRTRLLKMAAELGIATPRTELLDTLERTAAMAGEWTLPAVVKLDGTSNGLGVVVAGSPEAVTEAWVRLNKPTSLLAALKRRVINGDRTAFLRAEAEVSLQEFVAGTPANAMYACDRGRVLAAMQVRVRATQHAAGSAVVVERMQDARIAEAGEKLAAALGVSGFFGLDFHLVPETGRPVLLEMNPRATQLGHLALSGDEHLGSLCGALWTAWSGKRQEERAAGAGAERIGFYPQTEALGVEDPILKDVWLDRPTGEPELLRELAGRPWHYRRLTARVYDALRRPEHYTPVHFE